MSKIMLCNGTMFDLLNPDDSDYGIEEVAHALSNIARFNGHTRKFYSVAQHCVLMSQWIDQLYAREALLHDMQEAFVGDVATPLKLLIEGYWKIEHVIQNSMCDKFGVFVNDVRSKTVKQADLRMLMTEKRDLMSGDADWSILEGVDPYDEYEIYPWSPSLAKRAFITRYDELTIS